MSDSDSLSNKYLPWTETHKIVEIRERTISKIELTEQELAKLSKIINSNKCSDYRKEVRQRTIIGTCVKCSCTPSFKVTFHYEGLSKIERYCDKCLEQEKDKGNINQK